MSLSATYSPDDNKLRLYSDFRLDKETYARVKAAGFKWAPKQDLFVAPMWTPGREDLLLELCGEIDDEDTSLVDRAEARADRYEERSERNTATAKAAHAVVDAICEHIPLGQPILVGHHSERRARRDVDRIHSNMGKAVAASRAADYWSERAAAAIKAAKYKERPDVRARRISRLEAELRKSERSKAAAEDRMARWATVDASTSIEQAQQLGENEMVHFKGELWSLYSLFREGRLTPVEARELIEHGASHSLASALRWIEHYTMRLQYERAMLADQGGTVADQTKPAVGGAVRCWAAPRGGWAYIRRVNKISVTIEEATSYGDPLRTYRRTMKLSDLVAVMTPDAVEEARAAGRLVEVESRVGFVLRAAAE